MYAIILALLMVYAEAGIIHPGIECVAIRGLNYEKEILKSDVHSPYQLAIDYDTNTLFFSYTAKTSETFKIAYLSLKTSEYGIVKGIHGGFANAVDGKSHTVYMGGEDGIYKFDYATKSAAKSNNDFDANIWQMFFKDGLYFTTYPNEKAYLLKNGAISDVTQLKDKVMVMAVKKNGDFLYSNSSGLFVYKQSGGLTHRLGDYTVNGITADIDGDIYFSTPGGLYYIDDRRDEIDEMSIIDNIYGIAVEGNGNIIYANEDSIIRLKPTKKVCAEENSVLSNLN